MENYKNLESEKENIDRQKCKRKKKVKIDINASSFTDYK